MNEAVNWIAVVGAGGGGTIIAFVTFWMALSSRITSAEERAKSAEEKVADLAKTADERVRSADTLASAAIAKCELITREMNGYRVEQTAQIAALQAVSEATTKSLTQAEIRLAKSIDDLGEKMDHLGDTIIKTLGDMVGRARTGTHA